jgi:D-alanyl-D-alanine carboxypeptidase
LLKVAVESAEAAEPAVPPITGAAAIVIDRNTGVVLGVKNPDQQRAMASTTKMMTALLAIEQNGSNLDALVGPISAYAAGIQGTQMNLNAGDRISLRELLYGLMLPSGNDAAAAIAEWVSGSEANFVTLMNQRAQQLGLGNTAYRNPYGLDPSEYGASCAPPFSTQTNCGHYSSARDLVSLARFAMNQPLFAQIVRTVSYTPSTWVNASNNPRTITLSNDNLLLSSMSYPGANGVKTGATPAAGFCLVASATQSSQSVMSVVMGCSSNNVRHTESRQLLDFGFSQLGEFANGSFEQNYSEWTGQGNQVVLSCCASDGVKAVRFNGGQTAPNAVLSQSFATIAGQSYTLSFGYGVFSAVSQKEQRMQVAVQGGSVLLSQTISQSAFSSTVQYTTRNYSFVADSSVTTLTFRDISLVTDSVDSFLDYVRLNASLQLTTAVSRKTHGTAGAFDIDLPLSGPFGVECRDGGGNYTIVFSFTNDVSNGNASVTAGTGIVSGSPVFLGQTMEVSLTGVSDIQKIAVTIDGVTDNFSQVLPDTGVSVNMLIGDLNSDKRVNVGDTNAARSRSGQTTNQSNLRTDVNMDGRINVGDTNLVRAHAGAFIP